MSDTILSVQNLTADFYTYEGVLHVLDNVNFHVKRGEIFGLVGESGCGKSVTSRMVMGLIAQNTDIKSGKIILNGKNILKLSDDELRKIQGKDVSMIFQDPMGTLNPVFKVEDQMANVIMKNEDVDKKGAVKKALKLLKLVDLPDPERILKSYSFELSGGMAQRVMIAIAISSRPKLLIADEPTTALDVTIQAQILKLIKDLNEKIGMSVLFITHDLGVVAQMTDRIGIMYAGSVIAEGDTHSILKEPKHPYTQGLINAIPRPEYKGEPLPSITGTVPNYLKPPNGCRFHPRCQYVFEKCLYDKPPMTKVSDNHYVACWLYNEEEKQKGGAENSSSVVTS